MGFFGRKPNHHLHSGLNHLQCPVPEMEAGSSLGSGSGAIAIQFVGQK
jgi:hypothetical protein